MKRSLSTSSSRSSSTKHRIKLLPSDINSILLSKLPMDTQTKISKLQKEIVHTKVMMFRELLKSLYDIKQPFKIVFENRNAGKYEMKRVVITRSNESERKSAGIFDDPYKFIEDTDEYVLDMNTIKTYKQETINFYADQLIDKIIDTTNVVKSTQNVFAVVDKVVSSVMPSVKIVKLV